MGIRLVFNGQHTYVEVSVVIELTTVLKPDDFRPWFAFGHANEHNFVAQDVLVVEVRSLCDSRSLEVSVYYCICIVRTRI